MSSEWLVPGPRGRKHMSGVRILPPDEDDPIIHEEIPPEQIVITWEEVPLPPGVAAYTVTKTIYTVAGGSGPDLRVVEFDVAETPPEALPGPKRDPKAPEPLKLDELGVVGEVVRGLLPYTEADTGSLVLDLLTSLGSCIGRGPYGRASNARHDIKIYLVVVGETSIGAKGQSRAAIRWLMEHVDPDWSKTSVGTGLSSGEGLAEALESFGKTFCAIQEEFGRVLTVMQRRGETLGDFVRELYDHDHARVLNRNPIEVRDVHFSFIGHITPMELKEKLLDVDIRNGFVNRISWCYSYMRQYLPDGGMPAPVAQRLGESLRERVVVARDLDEIRRDEEATKLWRSKMYVPLRQASHGNFLDEVLGRRVAQHLRYQLLFAALDGSELIRPNHLRAADVVMDYAIKSAGFIFGNSSGNPKADRVTEALAAALNRELTRKEIGDDVLSKNASAEELDVIRDLLLQQKRITVESRRSKGGGRRSEVWKLSP